MFVSYEQFKLSKVRLTTDNTRKSKVRLTTKERRTRRQGVRVRAHVCACVLYCVRVCVKETCLCQGAEPHSGTLAPRAKGTARSEYVIFYVHSAKTKLIGCE